jgi:uncharacterized protein
LCCNGVIFADLQLQASDDADRLRSLGLPVSAPRGPVKAHRLPQPCAAHGGDRCRIYAERPEYCRQFECALLKSVQAGRTKPAQALRLIRTAHNRAERVRRLLRALGDRDEHLALSVRFRRATRRLKATDLNQEAAHLYGRLTLAVHELNLVVHETFYPGSASGDA